MALLQCANIDVDRQPPGRRRTLFGDCAILRASSLLSNLAADRRPGSVCAWLAFVSGSRAQHSQFQRTVLTLRAFNRRFRLIRMFTQALSIHLASGLSY